jgi:hypothetical protein
VGALVGAGFQIAGAFQKPEDSFTLPSGGSSDLSSRDVAEIRSNELARELQQFPAFQQFTTAEIIQNVTGTQFGRRGSSVNALEQALGGARRDAFGRVQAASFVPQGQLGEVPFVQPGGANVPTVPTSGPSFLGGLFAGVNDLVSGVGTLGQNIGTTIRDVRTAFAAPQPQLLQAGTGGFGGGFASAPAPQMQQAGFFGGGAALPTVPTSFGFGIPGVDIVPNQTPGASLGALACISPRQSTSMRLPSRVDVPTMDSSGNLRFTVFKNMGRPLLFSGDVAAAKRVRRVAARARRARGGR